MTTQSLNPLTTKKRKIDWVTLSQIPLAIASIALMLVVGLIQWANTQSWVHPEISPQGAFHLENPSGGFGLWHYIALALLVVSFVSMCLNKNDNPHMNEFVALVTTIITMACIFIFLAQSLIYIPQGTENSQSSRAAFAQWANERYSVDLSGVNNAGMSTLMKTESSRQSADALSIILGDQKIIQSIKTQDGGIYLIAALGSELPITAK